MNVTAIILAAWRAAERRPFAWDGINDCLGWASGVAQTITGRDPISHLRGRYASARDAKRVMVAEGWSDMADVARSIFAEIPVAQARSGDWAWLANDDGSDTIGVFCRERIAARGETGMRQVPRARALKAFRVE